MSSSTELVLLQKLVAVSSQKCRLLRRGPVNVGTEEFLTQVHGRFSNDTKIAEFFPVLFMCRCSAPYLSTYFTFPLCAVKFYRISRSTQMYEMYTLCCIAFLCAVFRNLHFSKSCLRQPVTLCDLTFLN
jgi:hypothetical protein